MKQQSVFKALADPTRRSILRRLRKGSRTAGELAEAFPITRASLSHHFGILKGADLVRTERRGQHIVYSLNASVMEEVAALLMDLIGPDDGQNDEHGPEDGPGNAQSPADGPTDDDKEIIRS
jgi:DNA-binding transcriptional ArsR family regulator